MDPGWLQVPVQRKRTRHDTTLTFRRHNHACRSKNPISWSGISMHPIESTGYYTAMLVPVLAGPLAAMALTKMGFPPATAWLSA